MRALAIALFMLIPLSAAAQSPRTSDLVLDALKLDTLLVILQDEAVEAAMELAGEGATEREVQSWRKTLVNLNAPAVTGPLMRDTFGASISEAEAKESLAFFSSDVGQEFVALELSARQALYDPDIEMDILAMFNQQSADGVMRIDALERFIVANDLINTNVLGALNANAAFLQGMREGDFEGVGRGLNDADIARQVWQQEPIIRESTSDWVRAFLWLAYQPVSDDDLAAYIAFSETEAGKAMNLALFAAFDAMFVQTSYKTGEALALLMAAQDI